MFLKNKHKIKRQQIEIKLTDPPDPVSVTSATTPDALRLDYYPDLIEVTFDNNIDADTIQLYLEGKRSGGKKEKIVESIKTIEEGVIHVKFESPDGMKKSKVYRAIHNIFINFRCSSCYCTRGAFNQS